MILHSDNTSSTHGSGGNREIYFVKRFEYFSPIQLYINALFNLVRFAQEPCSTFVAPSFAKNYIKFISEAIKTA